MWNRIIFGRDVYHVVMWFLTYSILGWIVESAYMSVCNRKWTNRGFSRGPFCPIYGVDVYKRQVLNQEYADMIGADFYGKDAMQSVYYAQSVFEKK